MFEEEILEPGYRAGGLPEGLAEMQPGAELARVLEELDHQSLSGFDRVTVMQARARLVSHFHAALYSDMLEVADSMEDLMSEDFDFEAIEDSTAMEIRAALNLTRRAAETQLDFAHLLCERLPQVWVALDAGWIDLPRARVIVDQTLHLDATLAQAVSEEVVVSAGSMTTGELRARIARLVITVDPESAAKRYQDGLEERRLASEANPDGTANFHALNLPPAEIQAAMRRINRLARSARSKDDPRTIDQIRADVLLDLLRGRVRGKGHDRGVVDISVDHATLTGLNDDPGSIPGWGPVIADVARRIVSEQSEAEHRVTVTGDDGEPIWTGVTRRRPTAAQRREIEARTPTCVFPGCRMPASECDIDHHLEWVQRGPTEDWNLGPLCRHDHVGRHRGWRLQQTRPGVYKWTSPLGHTYTVGPGPP